MTITLRIIHKRHHTLWDYLEVALYALKRFFLFLAGLAALAVETVSRLS